MFQADKHGEYAFEWELWVICDADAELRAQGIVTGQATKVQVAEQRARVRISFVRAMIGRCEGDWSRPAALDRFPVMVDAPKPKPVIIEGLLDGWATETQKSGKALYDRQRTVAAFVHHLGRHDAARVTADDVVAYKEARLAKGVSVKTVANDLNELSPIFTWAKRNRKLVCDRNPFAGIAPLKRTTATRQRDPYTVEEARDLLVAARAQTGFLRWFPWLLCFTGARLGELLQADKEDILPIGGVADAWALHIHANGQGRTLKTPQSQRHVPLHPAFVAEGFLAYVASLDDKSPLFPGIGLNKFGTRKGRGGNEHSDWVRDVVGIKDKRKDPAHAWRHLFETRGRQARVPKDVRDALTGHKLAGNASDDYGESYQFMPETTFEYVGRMSNPVTSGASLRDLMNAVSPALSDRQSGRGSGFQSSPVALPHGDDARIVHLHMAG